MKKAVLDTPVLMVFFIRPEPFRQVFEAVKLARPKRLYLFQDGARDNHPNDEPSRMACRKILDEIDWECEVNTFYPDFNYGVDACVYVAMQWAFKSTDRLIILEDDIVASPSFFKFCDVLLEEYKDDQDIAMIGGMNHLGEYHANSSSYLFAGDCAIWGWATWKRFFETWDRTLVCIEDPEQLKVVKAQLSPSAYKNQLKKTKRVREQALADPNKASFEASSLFARVLNRQMAIVPTKNLISNIGIGQDAFHAADSLKKLSRVSAKLFFMPRHELGFPLVAPKEKIQDIKFDRKIDWLISPPSTIAFLRKVSSRLRRLIFK